MAIEYETPTTGSREIPFSNGSEQLGLVNKPSEGGSFINDSVGSYGVASTSASEAKVSAQEAEASQVLATQAEVQTALDRVATGNDVTATNADVTATNADVISTSADEASASASAAAAFDSAQSITIPLVVMATAFTNSQTRYISAFAFN